MKFIDQFRAARRVSCPLVMIRTVDPASTQGSIMKVTNGDPCIAHDIVRGARALNDAGANALATMMAGKDAAKLTNPTQFLADCVKLPAKTIIFFSMMPQYMKEPTVVQALWNARDILKQDFRMIVMTTPGVIIPAELTQDILVLDEPMPGPEQLAEIVTECYTAANENLLAKRQSPLPELTAKLLARSVDALNGLATFAAETTFSMSLTKDGIDFDNLWERKRKQIENTPGLGVYRGTETFADVRGVDAIVTMLTQIMEGDDPPGVVVFLDEGEKMFAGSSGDTTDSSSQELTGLFLTWCEEKLANGKPKVKGVQCVGIPGVGKSLIAKACGNQFGRLTVMMNVSSMKASLLGQTGENMRNALKVSDAVAGGKPVLLIMTQNDNSKMPPELSSRFSFGTWMFDEPDEEGRDQLWKLYTKFFAVPDAKRPADEGWTGREIRNCCMMAQELKLNLRDAAAYVVPVTLSGAEKIAKLRTEATGRYICAKNGGTYNMAKKTKPTAAIPPMPAGKKRSIELN